MIYLGLSWLSEWLVAVLPFFQNQIERTWVSYGFLHSIHFVRKKVGNSGEQRGEILVRFQFQCRAVSIIENGGMQ